MISTFINTQETSNGTKNFHYKASHFVNEEIVQTLPRTTQQSISPFHPALTSPNNKNKTLFIQTTLQSTVKTSVNAKYWQMHYQTHRPIIKWRQSTKQKHTDGNDFAMTFS